MTVKIRNFAGFVFIQFFWAEKFDSLLRTPSKVLFSVGATAKCSAGGVR
jgi:hypothetical protein